MILMQLTVKQLSNLFDDALSILSGAEFEEKPVDLATFVSSKDFMGLQPLSKHQFTMVQAMSQIYRKDTLVYLFGEDKGELIHKQTYNEVILQLAKGAGKNHATTVAILYLVYQLLCLKSPAEYFGKDDDNNIDILNMAINADQARTAFFNPLTSRLKKCRWFDGRYEIKNREILSLIHI